MGFKIMRESTSITLVQMEPKQWGVIVQVDDKDAETKFGDIVFCLDKYRVINMTRCFLIPCSKTDEDEIYIDPLEKGTAIEVKTER